MFNVKVYADFTVAPAAKKPDRLFLGELRDVRDQTGARFVNFSVYDYRKENPDTVHFLTYPMDWISQYIRNFYLGVDPLVHFDFRRASVVDWLDLYHEPAAASLFEHFVEAGIGNHGISVATHAGASSYCVLSLVYRSRPDDWAKLRAANVDLFRFHCDRLGEHYFELFESRGRTSATTDPTRTPGAPIRRARAHRRSDRWADGDRQVDGRQSYPERKIQAWLCQSNRSSSARIGIGNN